MEFVRIFEGFCEPVELSPPLLRLLWREFYLVRIASAFRACRYGSPVLCELRNELSAFTTLLKAMEFLFEAAFEFGLIFISES